MVKRVYSNKLVLMKQILFITVFSFFSVFSFGNQKTEKTFLVLFHEDELKKFNISPAKIKLNFLDKFDTRAYSGNSEASLLITVPHMDWDNCDMGKVLVIVGKDRVLRLEEVAFRIVDLDKTKEDYQYLLSSSFGESKGEKKKSTAQTFIF